MNEMNFADTRDTNKRMLQQARDANGLAQFGERGVVIRMDGPSLIAARSFEDRQRTSGITAKPATELH